jgi:prolipoprotein diacylglyceryltransferase
MRWPTFLGFSVAGPNASALLRKDRLWSDTPRPNPQSLIDLALYAMLGTVIGGRLLGLAEGLSSAACGHKGKFKTENRILGSPLLTT